MTNKEYHGHIMAVRAVEDAIRASHKYTEGVKTMFVKHPIQGEDFPSRSISKYYEVYPTLDVSKKMSIATTIDWLWGDVRHIDVTLKYDYRCNKGSVCVPGNGAIGELCQQIPGFRDAIDRLERKS